LRAGYRWDAGLVGLQLLRLDLDAGNLLDARYRVHGSGLDSPGRGVSATLSAQW
jgi:outer membrane receptor protein involved in Fe transport